MNETDLYSDSTIGENSYRSISSVTTEKISEQPQETESEPTPTTKELVTPTISNVSIQIIPIFNINATVRFNESPSSALRMRSDKYNFCTKYYIA